MKDMPGQRTIQFLDLKAINTSIEEHLLTSIERVLKSGVYILGNEVEIFESKFAEYCQAKHCLGVANGLEALVLILRALDVGASDEVIVPSNTFIATWLAVSEVGAKIVPVEPDITSYNLDPQLVEAAITDRTKAIIAVHLYGQTANIPELRKIVADRKIYIIEDAAQAHGAKCNGLPAGTLGDAAAFSFYPGKNLGALGDAGAITTNDEIIAEKVRMLRNYGSKQKYIHCLKGINSRLDPLQAAILSAKLDMLEAWNKRRQEIASAYNESFSHFENLTIPQSLAGHRSVWHLYVIRHPLREMLRQELANRGIETLIHYPIPPHKQAAYSDITWPDLNISERLAHEVLSLPIGPHLQEQDVQYIIEQVQEAVFSLRQPVKDSMALGTYR